MIAALYVETGGAYYGLPDVEPWDIERDARLYAGPWPVVAHPPCARWSIMSLCNPLIAHLRGQDDGCFAAALEAVRTWGGVLEHPAYSRAWQEFELPRPARFGWTSSLLDPGWACHVDQGVYGHECHKPTWLYYVGPEPGPLDARDGGNKTRTVRHAGKRTVLGTPEAFRDVLLDLARTSDRALAV